MKQETKPIYITEEESLILWQLLEDQVNSCQQIHAHSDICKLFAKVAYKAKIFGDTLTEGETVGTIYKSIYGGEEW